MIRFGGADPWARLTQREQEQVQWHREHLRGLPSLRGCSECAGLGVGCTRCGGTGTVQNFLDRHEFLHEVMVDGADLELHRRCATPNVPSKRVDRVRYTAGEVSDT